MPSIGVVRVFPLSGRVRISCCMDSTQNSTENQSDSIKEGPYQNCRILAWWQDVHKPEQGWWVKVFVDGQYKWVPYQEVYAPAAKRRRRSKSV